MTRGLSPAAAGIFLLKRGEPGRNFYIIIEGRAEVIDMETLGHFMAVLISALKDLDDHQNRISTQ